MNYMDHVLYNAVTQDDVSALNGMAATLRLEDQLTATNSTVLHLACQYGSRECVHRILTLHKHLLLEINSRGETALHLAAKQGQLDVVQTLINSARDLSDQQNSLPNRTAASTIVQDLIRTADEDLETALHGAVRYNFKHVVELLVKEDPSHPNLKNKYKETPLYLASIRYYTDIISVILDNCNWSNVSGAGGRTDLHAMFGGPEGRTALHAAVLDTGGHACVELLLNRNHELLKEVDDYGWTVFHYVAHNNLDTIVELLVRDVLVRGADDKYVVYQKDNVYARTPLHLAAYMGNLRVMKKFVKYFPDSWEMTDGSGRNILHIAVEENRWRVINFIVSRGFKASNNLLTKRDNNGNTPLHLMTKSGCFVPELINKKKPQWKVDLMTKLGCFVPKLMNKKKPHWKVDWEVLDSNNCTPLDVLYSEQETHTLANQVILGQALIEAKVKKHWWVWRTLKQPDMESGKRIVKRSEKINKEQVEEYRKAISSQMVVTALIATVAFSALFNVPGGFDGSTGSPVLMQNGSFRSFVYFNEFALFFSVFSLLFYFTTSFNKDARQVKLIVVITAILNFIGIISMMAAFISGSYAMLAYDSDATEGLRTMTFFFLFFYFPLNLYVLQGRKYSLTLFRSTSV